MTSHEPAARVHQLWGSDPAATTARYDKGGNSIELSSFAGAAAPALRGTGSTTGSTFCGNTFAATPYTDGSSAFGDPRRACVVDTRRPTVAITAPAAVATVAGTIPVTAAAADDKGVTRVDVTVDGALLAATPPPRGA